MTATLGSPLPSANADAMLAAMGHRLAEAGLSITREEALMLVGRRAECLTGTGRIEFGTPALVSIADAIATSPCLLQADAAEVLANLQDAFYSLRDEVPVDVPDAEIVEALRGWLDAWGDAADAVEASVEEVMAFSTEYARAQAESAEACRIVDDEGHVYTFDSAEWDYDELANGWDGERWDDEWSDERTPAHR